MLLSINPQISIILRPCYLDAPCVIHRVLLQQYGYATGYGLGSAFASSATISGVDLIPFISSLA